MPNSTELMRMFDQWVDWLTMCANLPISAPSCKPLWEWVMYGCIITGLWLVGWFFWTLISYRLKYNAAIRAEMERERVAPADVMEDHKFKEVGDLADDVTDPHLAQKIRAELDRQKLEKMTGKVRG